ncbi:MAG: diphosphate--fructose-6-phosphate 1-phosphotransferase [Sphaerochaetaceae bacterium]|nr:diphosphate--fructose-6-phosphate 1-phosphotransferase [Sphaerochaetaceae bacterium]HHU89324.1 diphosphate--fructose-6-phosphate 1-phosphotransferase [Spirochaetales bacterium]
MEYSPLQKARYAYKPKLPLILRDEIGTIEIKRGAKGEPKSDQKELKALFPNTYGMESVSFTKGSTTKKMEKTNVGVILSGGQAPGGHNVIAGLFDAIKNGNPESKLFGFLGGPSGILEDKYVEITSQFIDQYRNTGGFDIIGSGRTKLETEEQFATCAKVCHQHDIKAIVIIGGDDSNTNAAILAEYFIKTNAGITVVGCPKTIDGDLKNEQIEISFGFDTATKTYSELIGNLMRDANSAKKYWHFIRLMGRSASHIALECALMTQPNACLIGEELAANNTNLTEIVEYLASIIVKRAEKGMNFGIALIPEGIVEFVPEMRLLIGELNTLLAVEADAYGELKEWEEQYAFIEKNLTPTSAHAFTSLPRLIQEQLLKDRDPHGNVQVSLIETEKMLIEMVEARLAELKAKGEYKGKFGHQSHFFGYEGRCAFPSNFDSDYCYSLGYNAYLLIANGCTGYISSITNLTASADQWQAGGIPITMMFNMESRHGEMRPVIEKALVDLNGGPFKYFAAHRDSWAVDSKYLYPGAIQYYGPTEVCDTTTKTLQLEHN